MLSCSLTWPPVLASLLIPTHPLLHEQLPDQRRHDRDEDHHHRSSVAVCLFSGALSQPYLLYYSCLFPCNDDLSSKLETLKGFGCRDHSL